MDSYGIRAADPSEVDEIAEVLALAFQDDPVSSWVFPGAERRRLIQPAFFTAFTRLAFDSGGEVYRTEDFSAAMLWLPGGEDESGDDMAARFAALDDAELARFLALAEVMAAGSPPRSDYLHAQFLGVLPGNQRAGIGAAVFRYRLDSLDAEGTPSYLEASSLTSARLYRRLGYEHLGEPFSVEGGPSMWPMWRDPSAPVGGQ